MALSLADIRAKLKAQEDKKNGTGGSFGDGLTYPHWNINEGDTARIRLLPDANPANNFFWIEKAMIKLPFSGIVGQPDSKPCIVQVPCIEMWPEMGMCPILTEVRTWFKDKSLEEMGRKYWKKKSYIMQGFVRDNPLKEDKTPENPIRRFIISPQIFNTIKAALMDPELENLPTDYENGLDFNIKKTSKGGYADYSTSTWARKETSLTVDELEAIEKYGLASLADALPKKPTDEELVIMKEMFEASVDGQAYDPERWSKYFKPAGFQTSEEGTSTASPAPAPRQTPAAPRVAAPSAPAASSESEDIGDNDDDTPSAESPVTTPAAAATGGNRAEAILSMIRNRQKTA